MLRERIVPQSEVIRAIVLEDSPFGGVPHQVHGQQLGQINAKLASDLRRCLTSFRSMRIRERPVALERNRRRIDLIGVIVLPAVVGKPNQPTWGSF